MKLAFVSVDNGLVAIGFRKMAAVARLLYPDTEVLYVAPANFYSSINFLIPRRVERILFSEKDINNISEHLALFDMVCFSSMTAFAELTKKIITNIRKIKPDVYIVWGGIHPIVNPSDAVEFADAICTGEGERAFREFITSYANGSDFTTTKNFWFNENGTIIKNSFFPLNTSQEMGEFPFLLYADRELIYDTNKQGFTECGLESYLTYNNLTYNAVWSIGCPNNCTYCSNSKFIENDKKYKQLRYPDVEYIITEIESVLLKHPHISTVFFQDDSFMAIPYATIEKFASAWKERIGVRFAVFGLIPRYADRAKIEVLVQAGMYRVRMGIQSGSDRVLKFYKRPTQVSTILASASIIAEFKQRMSPPSYDFIVDNPFETRQDIVETLELIYALPRPFTLGLYSLRVIPNTELAREFENLNVDIVDIKKTFLYFEPTVANLLAYTMTLFNPPKWIFQGLLSLVKPSRENQTLYPRLLIALRAFFLIKKVTHNILFRDFSLMMGKVGYVLWKTGLNKDKTIRSKQRLRLGSGVGLGLRQNLAAQVINKIKSKIGIFQ